MVRQQTDRLQLVVLQEVTFVDLDGDTTTLGVFAASRGRQARAAALAACDVPTRSSASRNTTFPHPATFAVFIVAAVGSSIRLIAAAFPGKTDPRCGFELTSKFTVVGAWPDVADGAELPGCCDLGMLMANRW
jgi:hypothetical protein